MIKRPISTTLLVIGFWSLSLSAFADSETDADAVVTRFHNSLITMIKAEGYENRLALMRPIIAENFDTQEVATVALGRNWRQLSNEEKSELTQLSSEVLASGYASRFPNYTDQQFTIGKSTPIVPDRMIVKSKLQTGSETVNLDYQLIEVEGKWKIFDVVADGDSDLSQKRSIYTETFRTTGLDGVIKDIKQHITDNSKK
jgi:phospholipid transport system substrate-binding protein